MAVQERKSANLFLGNVMNGEWDSYFYEKKSISAVQPKEKNVEKVGAASGDDLLVEVPKAATNKKLKEKEVDIEKEYSVVKVGAASEDGKPIKSIVEKDTKISMDGANTTKYEKDVLMGVPTAASERELKFVIDLKNEFFVSETMGEPHSKLSLTFPIPVKESNPDSLISYVNQSLMTASDDMNM